MGYPGWAYDLFLWPLDVLGLRAARVRLTEGVRGRVLELGIGTGLNLAAAPAPDARVVAVDRDVRGLRRARARAPGALLVCADAQALPFRDAVFDVAFESLVFCSLARPDEVLGELRRVLRHGGELRMLDHVRAPGPVLGRLQDALAPAWLKVTGECHLNRDLSAVLDRSGWKVTRRLRWARGLIEEVVARS